MRNLTQELWGVSLFLKRVRIVSRSYDLNLIHNEFPFLTLTLRRDQRATHRERRSSCEPLNRSVIRQRVFGDDLKIAKARTVVELDERKILRITPRPYPALDVNRIDWRNAF